MLSYVEERDYDMLKGYLLKASEKRLENKKVIPYNRKHFLVVSSDSDIEKKYWDYQKNKNTGLFGLGKTNYDLAIKSTINGLCTSCIVQVRKKNYRLKSILLDNEPLAVLTTDIVREEFPNTEISKIKTSGLYLLDLNDDKKLIPADQFDREMRKAKLNAFCRLCQYFGATKVTLAYAQDKGRERMKLEHTYKGRKENGPIPKSFWDQDRSFRHLVESCKDNDKSGNALKRLEGTIECPEHIDIDMSDALIKFLGTSIYSRII